MARVSIDVKRTRGGGFRPLRESDLAEVGAIFRDGIVSQARAGMGADGRRFRPQADGTPSTLTKTGALLASVAVTDLDRHGVEVRPGVSYAADVQAERPFMGISPTTEQAARSSLRDAFAANVALADVKNRRAARALKSGERVDGDDEEPA